MSKYYKKHLVPLLRCLGMQLSGPDLYVWSWLPHMRDYVDRTYTTEFRNLSENGEVSASTALLELVPDMLLRAESRVRSAYS